MIPRLVPDSVILNDDPIITPMDGGAQVIEDGDNLSVDFSNAAQTANISPDFVPGTMEFHRANLVDQIDDQTLSQMAQTLLEQIEADKGGRQDWERWVAKSLQIFGLTENSDVATQPAASQTPQKQSQVVHPLLAEAVVQTQARMLGELLPSGGPAKGLVLGQKTRAKEEQAERVSKYMNYYLTEKDRGYFYDTDRMFMFLGKDGSVFRKVYNDPITGMNLARFVKGEDLIVPYTAVTLDTAARITHRFALTQHEYRKSVASGTYADVDLGTPDPQFEPEGEAQEAYDKADKKEMSIPPDDGQFHFYETQCYWDFAEKIQNFGPDGTPQDADDVPLPYIITMERATQKVVAIRRNWKMTDPEKCRRKMYVHYGYIPGYGFYCMGLTHIIGHLSNSATGIVRALLDSAFRANFPGGFKAKNSAKKTPAGEYVLNPGEWKDIDATADDLRNMFFPLPYKEPSPAMFEVLEIIVAAGQRFASTTESMVGDASNTGPVGTTVALIEQGSKILTAVHKRVHAALREELRLLSDLHAEYGEDITEYNAENSTEIVYREDFDDRVDVAPVSDPNLSSTTQRMAIAQMLYQLSQENPDLYDRYEIHRYLLNTANVPMIDTFLHDPQDIPRFDPASEGAMLVTGKPIKAFYDQNHPAHLAVHNAQLQYFQTTFSPEQSTRLIAQMMEHVAKHQAYDMLMQVNQAMPMQTEPIDLYDDQNNREGMPPDIENQISPLQAQVVTQLMMQAQIEAQAAAEQQPQQERPQ